METFELKDRELIEIPPPPSWAPIGLSVGVALTNEEAQEFIAKEYRVRGDDKGPFLIVKLRKDRHYGLVWDSSSADVTVTPRRWYIIDRPDTGIICWAERII